jgi:hypothetical protein
MHPKIAPIEGMNARKASLSNPFMTPKFLD